MLFVCRCGDVFARLLFVVCKMFFSLTVGNVLCVVSCMFCVVRWLLFAACCLCDRCVFCVVCCLLIVVRCLSAVGCGSLFVVCCSLFVVRCLVFGVRCLLLVVRCLLPVCC